MSLLAGDRAKVDKNVTGCQVTEKGRANLSRGGKRQARDDKIYQG